MPIYNVDNMTDAQKSVLEKIMPDGIMSGVPATNIYSFDVKNPDAIGVLLDENYIKTGTFKGTGDYKDDLDDIMEDMFSGKNSQYIAEEFGNNIRAAYDPVGKTYMFELKPGKATGKEKQKYGSIQFKVDEEVVAGNGILNKTYGKY